MSRTFSTNIQTCKLNDVDPQAWLTFVLAKLPDHPAKKIDVLLPWNWKAAKAADQATPVIAAA
jgi:transposase